jgi:hypothetical protein
MVMQAAPVGTQVGAAALRSSSSTRTERVATENTGIAATLGLANDHVVAERRDDSQGQGQSQGGDRNPSGAASARVGERSTLAAQIAFSRNTAVNPLLARGVENVPTAFTTQSYIGRTVKSGYTAAFNPKFAAVTGRNSNFMLATNGPQVALAGGDEDGVPASWAKQIRGGFSAAYANGAREGLSFSPNA